MMMKNRQWGTVSIFISSTFQDMHGERDYLVKEVFPELLSWCESRRLHLYDIDLRWGITAEDSENHNTVAACLHNIDRCRPFFICFMGQRRGWVPDSGEVNADSLEEYPALSGMLGKRSVTEMEIEHALIAPMNRMYEGVLQKQDPCRRALFYFRSGDYLKEVPPSVLPVYQDSEENLDSIARFKQVIRDGGYPVTEYSCHYEEEASGEGGLGLFQTREETLGECILRQLKDQISREFPDHIPDEESGDLSEEPALFGEEEFIWREEDSYYPQKEDMEELRKYLASDEQKALLVTGNSGSGKTSLMCALAREYTDPRRLIIRFCGVSAMTSDLYLLLSGILKECGIAVPPTENEMFAGLRQILSEIAAREDTVVILDGINQSRDGCRLLELLPGTLPKGLKMILSCKTEALDPEIRARMASYGNIREWTLKTACDKVFKRGMINRFLSLYLKQLDEDSIRQIAGSEEISSPLQVSVILSELRVFGRFEQIADQVRKLGGSIGEAFGEVLSRLDQESDQLSGALFGLMACSDHGLSEEELLEAIRHYRGLSPDQVRPPLRMLLRQVRPFLTRKDRLYDFFHESFRIAASERYKPEVQKMNSALADTFEAMVDPAGDRSYTCSAARPYQEYLRHLKAAGREEEAGDILMDPTWMRRKISVCGVQSLLQDYTLFRDDQALSLTGDALRLSASVLHRDPSQLGVQLTGRLHSCREKDPRIDALLKHLRCETKEPLFPVNAAFAGPGESSLVFRHSREAVTAMCLHLGDLVVTDEKNRIGIYDCGSGIRKSLFSAEGALIQCLVSDGRILYAGRKDGTVSLFHTQSSTQLTAVKLGEGSINALSISGDMLYAADETGTLLQYDLKEKKPAAKTRVSSWPLTAVDSDGNRILCGGLDQKATLLDHGKKTSWKTKSGYVGGAAVNGSRIVYSTYYPRLFFRNTETGEFLYTDYSDGYDFASEKSDIMNKWWEKGPYIRQLVKTPAGVLAATPFSVALFPWEGAKEPTESFPFSDVRAVVSDGNMVYAGNGLGMINVNKIGDKEEKQEGKYNFPVISIASRGNYVSVLNENSASFFETERYGEDVRFIHQNKDLNIDIPGFYTSVVPWKNGFAVGTFCEVTRWSGFAETEWHMLHMNMMLMLGINESHAPEGTQSMAASQDYLIMQANNQTVYAHFVPGDLDAEAMKKPNYYPRGTLGQLGSNVTAVAAFPDNRFVSASAGPDQLNVYMYGRLQHFPAGHRVKFMEIFGDRHVVTYGEDGMLLCHDVRNGEIVCSDPVPGSVLAMAVSDGNAVLGTTDGRLMVMEIMSGRVLSSIQADSDIRSVAVSGDLVFAGTENGRFMAFCLDEDKLWLQEEETILPWEQPGKTDMPVPDDPAENRDPEPAIRIVPKDSDKGHHIAVRFAASLIPFILTTIINLKMHGWKEFFSSISLGCAPGSVMSVIIGVLLHLLRLIAIFIGLIHYSTASIYYENMRHWHRNHTLQILDRYILPVVLACMSIPCIRFLSGTIENRIWATSMSYGMPLLFTLVYYQGVDLFQGKGTYKMSRDKTFVSMEQAFRTLRVICMTLMIIGIVVLSAFAPH